MTGCGTYAGYGWHRDHHEPACQPCLDAASLYEKKRLVERARTGPRRIDSQPLAAALQAATRSGISLLAVSTRCQLAHPTLWRIMHGRNQYVFRTTAARIELTLREMIAERQQHQHDCIDHLDYLHEAAPGHARQPGPRRWPARPLLDAVIARYGELMKSGYARQLHRLNQQGALTDEQADVWAHKVCDVHPSAIWPDWGLDLEEVS